MSWYYFLNRMGPCAAGFEGWAGGRVDADCADENDPDYMPYGHEVPVYLMNEEDWYEFGSWVAKLKTDSYVGKEIFAMYEKETGNKVRWKHELDL